MKFSEIAVGSPIGFGPLETMMSDDPGYAHGYKIDDSRVILTCPVLRHPFDVREYASEYRPYKEYGDSFFPISDLFCYLNSADASYFVSKDGSVQPEAYNAEHKRTCGGLLSLLSDEVLSCLQPMYYTCIVPSAHRGKSGFGKLLKIQSLVTVPSLSEFQEDCDEKFKIEGQYNPYVFKLLNEESSYVGFLSRTSDRGRVDILSSTFNGTSCVPVVYGSHPNQFERIAILISFKPDTPFIKKDTPMEYYKIDVDSIPKIVNRDADDLVRLLNAEE